VAHKARMRTRTIATVVVVGAALALVAMPARSA
jgi:hypothetical protein